MVEKLVILTSVYFTDLIMTFIAFLPWSTKHVAFATTVSTTQRTAAWRN